MPTATTETTTDANAPAHPTPVMPRPATLRLSAAYATQFPVPRFFYTASADSRARSSPTRTNVLCCPITGRVTAIDVGGRRPGYRRRSNALAGPWCWHPIITTPSPTRRHFRPTGGGDAAARGAALWIESITSQFAMTDQLDCARFTGKCRICRIYGACRAWRNMWQLARRSLAVGY